MFLRKNDEISQYYYALKSPALDSSGFILLSSAMLEKKIGNIKIQSEMKDILTNYINHNFNASIKIIIKICDTYKELKESKLINAICTKRSFILNDNPLQNQSRRFFESLLAQKTWDSLSEKEFKSIEKLSVILKEMDSSISPVMSVNSHEDISSIFILSRAVGEKHPDIMAIHDSLRQPSIVSSQKDRGAIKERIFSCQPGILRSSHPCFFDYVKKPELGRIVDMFDIDEKKSGFSLNNKQVPFVNSVSGTTFIFVSILNFYLQKSSRDLTVVINHIIKSYIAFVCVNGYHSLEEMFCVLKSPEIVKSFKKFNITLDLSFSENIIKSSYKESVEYAKKIFLNKLMHVELASCLLRLK